MQVVIAMAGLSCTSFVSGDAGAPIAWTLDLELTNRPLFRSQIIDDDQMSLRLGAGVRHESGWTLTSTLQTARGSGAIMSQSHTTLAKHTRALGFDVDPHLEYIRWHQSELQPMSLQHLPLRLSVVTEPLPEI